MTEQTDDLVRAMAWAIVSRRGLPPGCSIDFDQFEADARAALMAYRSHPATVDGDMRVADLVRRFDKIEAERDKAVEFIRSMNAVSLHQTDRPYRVGEMVRMRFHPLTCGNDSKHTPLFPLCEDGKVKLICRDCDYTQDNAGMFSVQAAL